MSTVRQDAWTNDEDLILAEVVLRHIREGSTQLAAFEEVAEKLNRTPAACGFRWNSTIRKKYTTAIELAKKQRKNLNLKVKTAKQEEMDTEIAKEPLESTTLQKEITLADVIQFLQQLQSAKGTNDYLLKENEELKKKNKELEKEIEQLKKEKEIVQEDYRLLINIMERARKMAMEKEKANNES